MEQAKWVVRDRLEAEYCTASGGCLASVRWQNDSVWRWTHVYSATHGVCGSFGAAMLEVVLCHAKWERDAAKAEAEIRDALGLDIPDE